MPHGQFICPGWRVIDGIVAVFVRRCEERILECHNHPRHLEVDFAAHLDNTDFIEFDWLIAFTSLFGFVVFESPCAVAES